MRDSKRDADVYNSLLDSVGEGEGGMIWENGTETCIISYKKRIANLGSMQDTGYLGLVHWDKPAFSFYFFIFIKKLFSSSLLSATRVVICISEVVDISPRNLYSNI